jgi:hypothetical protein
VIVVAKVQTHFGLLTWPVGYPEGYPKT